MSCGANCTAAVFFVERKAFGASRAALALQARQETGEIDERGAETQIGPVHEVRLLGKDEVVGPDVHVKPALRAFDARRCHLPFGEAFVVPRQPAGDGVFILEQRNEAPASRGVAQEAGPSALKLRPRAAP